MSFLSQDKIQETEFLILVFAVFLAGSLPVLKVLPFLYILCVADLFLPSFFPSRWPHLLIESILSASVEWVVLKA